MRHNQRLIVLLLALVLIISTLSGCDRSSDDINAPSGKITVVTTIFPPADFAKNIGGEYVDVVRLLKPGAESHTYEPTPKDILAIQSCDLFIYVGGESDTWIDEILSSLDNSKVNTIKMIDVVDALSEEMVEGMEEEHEEGKEEDEAEELDEHVWTSVKNAILISEAISAELCKIDSEHEATYKENCARYTNKLAELDNDYRDTINSAKRQEIIVADRFPFRYMAHEYGLTYYAAFPGCSAESEPSARTLSFLINKTQEDEIPVVFHIEFSNEKIADSVVEVCNAKKSLLHSCHNLSQEELDAGEDYLSIMQKNLINLKEALN